MRPVVITRTFAMMSPAAKMRPVTIISPVAVTSHVAITRPVTIVRTVAITRSCAIMRPVEVTLMTVALTVMFWQCAATILEALTKKTLFLLLFG